MQATVPQRVLIDFVIPSGWTQTQRNRIAVDVVLILGIAAFVSICAQLAIRFPTTTVPITGQTLGVLLTGGALGSVRGGLSMLTYMLMGMISLPVFAPTGSLLGEENIHFILPWAGTDGFVWELSSGGYIVVGRTRLGQATVNANSNDRGKRSCLSRRLAVACTIHRKRGGNTRDINNLL